MTEKPIIGETKCCDCGSRVTVRKDKGGKGYWYCNGELEGTGCSGRHTMGHGATRKLLTATVAAMADPKPEKPKKSRKENPEKQETETDDRSDRDEDAGGGVAGKFLKRRT